MQVGPSARDAPEEARCDHDHGIHRHGADLYGRPDVASPTPTGLPAITAATAASDTSTVAPTATTPPKAAKKTTAKKGAKAANKKAAATTTKAAAKSKAPNATKGAVRTT